MIYKKHKVTNHKGAVHDAQSSFTLTTTISIFVTVLYNYTQW